MTDEELGRRAVACARWRWMPGMLAERWTGPAVGTRGRWHGLGRPMTYRYSDHDVRALRWWPNGLPDLTDPATVGCMLALVREAWGEPALSVTAGYTKDRKVEWEVEHPHPDSLPEALWTYFDTEAEALVAALEAAP